MDEFKHDKRAVLYEELAEYFYLFARREALRRSSVQKEIDYHIGNLVLISLYFDVVLIQTATIFNASDPFVRKVSDGVLAHPTFRGMLDANALKIVGWGGNTPRDMFEAAEGFSRAAATEAPANYRFNAVASVFNSQSTLFRSLDQPDADVDILFRNRLEQTTIIRRPNQLEAVNLALEKSMEKTGQLVAVSFNPELEKLELSSQSVDAVGVSFIQSWHDHLTSQIPGIVTYAPLSNPIFMDQKIVVSESVIRTFLYSPQIFASFLGGYLRAKDFNEILKRPYSDLMVVKNGDWKRFVDAYHEAIEVVSGNVGHLVHADLSDDRFSDDTVWSKNISAALNANSDCADVNAFIESLAMLSGLIFSIPFLGATAKSVGALLGNRINRTFQTLRQNATLEISPFINKLLRHYELEGARA
ncbi:hypothetical protein [Maritalea sp.]|uniref:hypothetical protein n=1 Tax=Maritalea sp. TaxID=2003361 RepID=UPI003EF7E59A